jgi:hypothetical protein
LVHDDADDAFCNPALAVHDHDAHRFVPDSRSASSQPDHCYLCHWHSLRTVVASVQTDAPPVEVQSIHLADAAPLTFAGSAHVPARAPPLA